MGQSRIKNDKKKYSTYMGALIDSLTTVFIVDVGTLLVIYIVYTVASLVV